MRNEKRRHAVKGVKGKRNVVVMKSWVDEASLIRGSGTLARCGQRGVLRKCNQTDSELTVGMIYTKRALRNSETAQDDGKGANGRADEKDKESEIPRFSLWGCLFGASVVTNGPLPTVEEEQMGVILYKAQHQDGRKEKLCDVVDGGSRIQEGGLFRRG